MVEQQENQPFPSSKLLIPKANAIAMLKARIEEGLKIRNQALSMTVESTQNASFEFSKWAEVNFELLKRMFSESSILGEYEFTIRSLKSSLYVNDIVIKRYVDPLLVKLESLVAMIEFFSESIEHPISIRPFGKDIFIVHGHDEAAREAVARFVEKLGLKPIILHERANEGLTIIEKFEKNASVVSFAIALLTPDDICESSGNRTARARQNVILELGYFIGKFGRNRVCALLKPGVERPSDIHDIVYVSMDGNWQSELEREIKQAGIDISK